MLDYAALITQLTIMANMVASGVSGAESGADLTRADALAWYEDNLDSLLSIMRLPLDGGLAAQAAAIGDRLFPYLFNCRDWPVLLEVAGIVADASHAAGDTALWLSAEQKRGFALQNLGDLDAARDVFTVVANSAEQPYARAQAIAHLGQLARADHDLQEAARLLGEAILLYREAASLVGEARTLRSLANVRRDLGAREDARAANARALELLTQAGQAEDVAEALRAIASDHFVSGRLAEAFSAQREAARLYAQLGIRKDAQECYTDLAGALAHHRQYAEAREAIQRLRNEVAGQDVESGADQLSVVVDVHEAADQIIQARTDVERDQVVTRWPLLIDPAFSSAVPQAWRNFIRAGTAEEKAIPPAVEYLRSRVAGQADQGLQSAWQAMLELAGRDSQTLPEQVREHLVAYWTASGREIRIGELLKALPYVPQAARLIQGWFHRTLAREYLSMLSSSRPDLLEASIRHGEQALAFITHDADPKDWAVVHAALGTAYRQRLLGNQAANADAAITHFRRALVVYRRGTSPDNWAGLMTNLGNAYRQASGDQSRNLRRALARHRAALQVFTEHTHPAGWAQVNTNIGYVLMSEVFAGDPQNIERAISHLSRAARVQSVEPGVRAMIELNLSNCYLQRARGDAQENADAAIHHGREAYELFEELGDAGHMADSAKTVARAFARSSGQSAEDDLDEAIAWYQHARALIGPHGAPLTWAGATDELAGLYEKRHSGSREENWELAVELHSEAIDAYARSGDEIERARAQYNLARTLMYRGRDADFERAAELLELALEGPVETSAPLHWADSTVMLAQTWLRRSARPGSPEPILAALRRVAEVLGLSGPERTQKVWHTLGLVLADGRRWPEAAEAFLAGIASAERGYRASLLRSSKEDALTASADLVAVAAYALVQAGRPADATVVLERGRVRLVGDRLDQDRVELAQAREQHPVAYGLFEEATARLRVLEARQLRSQPPEGTGTPVTRDRATDGQLRAEIIDARGQQEAAIAAIRQLPGSARFLDQPDWSTVSDAVATGEALAYLLTTDYGSAAVVVLAGDRTPITALTPLTWSEMHTAFGSIRSASTDPAPGSLQSVLDSLGERLIGPLAGLLNQADVRRIHLVATGLLGRLPLHAARFTDGQKTIYLCDRFDISYAPSARLLSSARTAAGGNTDPVLAGIANPLPNPRPLLFSEQELACVSALFPTGSSRLRYGETATRASLLDMLPGATYVHLSCHGGYDFRDPMASGLELGSGDTLTLADLLSGGVLASARLVVASACQSAVIDALRTVDEALGLPTAFLLGGVAGVIGTLWSVPDISCALLITRFYALHLHGNPDTGEAPMPPPKALCRAQRWLRTVNASELADIFQGWLALTSEAGASGINSASLTEALAEQSARFRLTDPELRPYAAPRHWAPYILVGV